MCTKLAKECDVKDRNVILIFKPTIPTNAHHSLALQKPLHTWPTTPAIQKEPIGHGLLAQSSVMSSSHFAPV